VEDGEKEMMEAGESNVLEKRCSSFSVGGGGKRIVAEVGGEKKKKKIMTHHSPSL